MKTIVEYCTDLPPRNEYPHRIVSPAGPSACCVWRMERESGLSYLVPRQQRRPLYSPTRPRKKLRRRMARTMVV